jgi:ion channel-forming bestrophin family protein
MHIGKSYRLTEFLGWTRRRAYVLLLLGLVPVTAYQLLGWHWLALPWPIAVLLGTATSFIVGFKNAQTYNRTVEAQQVWTSIVVVSRYWALICRDFPKDRRELPTLLRRHLAWLTALRYQARDKRVWETSSSWSNEEYRRRNFTVPEHETPLESELRKHLTEDELTDVLAVENKPAWLLGMQSDAIRQLYTNQDIVVLHHTEMEKTLKDLLDQQGRVERIKNFPYPRQYAVINSIFVWCFATLLPLTLVREFDRLNEVASGPLAGHMAWLAAPFAAFIAWLYAALDQVGASTENPFEGNANDVPITRMCMHLEDEFLGFLGELRPKPLPAPDGHIVL